MLYKSRTKTKELLILESLNNRMTLPEQDQQRYVKLKKGYEGEVVFDKLTEKLQCDTFILNDLLLKVHNTTFQIDSLIITSSTIYLYEVKNFEGDYYYESDKLYFKSKTEINDPLIQLNRGESLFRQLLFKLGFNLSIDASVVFINPEFTLFQVPLSKPIILPTQINRYMKKLNRLPSKLTNRHRILAEKLVSLHIEDAPINSLPSYDYEILRKGITCEKCHSLVVSVKGMYCTCQECQHKETVTKEVLRNISEFRLLFPSQKITTTIIHDWCQVVTSKKRINRILERHFRPVGGRRWTYYESIVD